MAIYEISLEQNSHDLLSLSSVSQTTIECDGKLLRQKMHTQKNRPNNEIIINYDFEIGWKA